MSDPGRFAAFISHAEIDAPFAKRLKRALESWRPPAARAGVSADAARARRLGPIYLEREDAGTRATALALSASDALVVVCSPDAAESARVRRDIDAFIARGARGRIVAVIADTAPLLNSHGQDAAPQCFPPALHGAALADGDGVEALVADARAGKGGWRDAWLTVATGVAGLDPPAPDAGRAAAHGGGGVASALIASTLIAAVLGGGAWLWGQHLEVRAHALAGLAHAAAAEGRHDRAMRYALAALEGADLPFLGHDAAEAVGELANAARANRLRARIEAPGGGLVSATFDPAGARVLTVSKDGEVRLFEARRLTLLHALNSAHGPIHSARFDAGGALVTTIAFETIPGAGGAYREAPEIWDADTGLRAPRAAPGANLAYDSRRIPAFYDTGWTRWTETLDAARTRAIDYNTGDAGDFSSAIVWDVGSGRVISTLQHHKARPGDLYEDRSFAISAAVLSPDGKLAATAATDGLGRVWDAGSGIELLRWRISEAYGRRDAANDIQFSPDGRTLLTQGRGGVARLWSVATGQAVRGWPVGTAPAAFAPRGDAIVAIGASGVSIWRRDGGGVAFAVPDQPRSAALTADGTRALTWTPGASTLQLWDAGATPGGAQAEDLTQPSPNAAPDLPAPDLAARGLAAPDLAAPDLAALRARACAQLLAPAGLSVFSAGELAAAPLLDSELDRDVCRTPALAQIAARAPALLLRAVGFYLARIRA